MWGECGVSYRLPSPHVSCRGNYASFYPPVTHGWGRLRRMKTIKIRFLQNSTSLSRIDRTRSTKLREDTKSTVTGTLAGFGYERTPGWAGRVQKRVFRILELGNWGEHKMTFLGVLGWVWGAWALRVGWGCWCGAVLRVWAQLADVGFEGSTFLENGRKTAISGVWGGFGVLGLCGWAGGAGAGQCCEFGRFRFGGQINTGFSFK